MSMERYMTLVSCRNSTCALLFVQGTPEDLLFFYKIVFAGMRLTRVDQVLMVYRYHRHNTTGSIEELSCVNIIG